MWMFVGEAATAVQVLELAGAQGETPEAYAGDDGSAHLVLREDDGGEPPDQWSVAAPIVFCDGGFGREGGEHMLMVGLWTPQEDRDELLSWYRQEHLPMLLGCSAWGGCRFVEVAAEQGSQFYALHQLWDIAALDSDQRKRSRDTDWFHRLKRKDWFDEPFTRVLLRRLGTRQAGARVSEPPNRGGRGGRLDPPN